MVGWSWQGVHLETGQGYDQDLGRRKFGTSFQEILMMFDHFRSLVCEYVWNSKMDFGVSIENQILFESRILDVKSATQKLWGMTFGAGV